MKRNSTTLFLETPNAVTPIPWVDGAPDFSGWAEPTLSVFIKHWNSFLENEEELEVEVEVIATDPPTYDRFTEVLEEIEPELVDDVSYQRWSVRPMTQEELDAVVYPPNWKGFNFALFTDPNFVQYGISAQTVNPYLVPSIIERYGQITKLGLVGSDFADYWNVFCASLSITVEHREQWAQLAEAHHLPAEFVTAIRD